MFSACEEAERLGLAPTSSNTPGCVAALQAALASNATAWERQFPFNVPPMVNPATLNESSNPDATCAAGQALSTCFGGECIDCGSGAPDVSGSSGLELPLSCASGVPGVWICSKPVQDAACVCLCFAYVCVLQASNQSCVCYSGYFTHLVDPTACGNAISTVWNVSSGPELARQLCAHYSRYMELVQQVGMCVVF